MVTARIVFSAHAIERYIARVRDVGDYQALRELERLAREGVIRPDPPPGVSTERPPEGWLWLSPDGSLACPLVRDGDRLRAVSLYARGAISDAARQRRSERKAYRRASRRVVKAGIRGRPRRDPDPPDEWAA